jgi:hypothetical protein
VDLEPGDMDAVMRASRRLKDAPPGAPGAVPEAGLSRAVACEWVRGAQAVWREWTPAVCPAGTTSDSTLTRCASAGGGVGGL